MTVDISKEESDDIFLNDIMFDYVENNIISASNQPQAIILGGQPGAGKSFLVNTIKKEFQESFIFISTDDLRLYHPAYLSLQQSPETVQNAANLVNLYASAWTERLILFCIENHFNIIIDSTLGGNIKSVYDTVDLLQKNNYSFHLRLMAVPALISKLSIFLRYENQLKEKGFARWTRMEDHDDRFEKIPSVLEQILSNKPPKTIRFYQRVLSEKITISLKPSQLFSFEENKIDVADILENFQQLRNQMFESDAGFIVFAITFIAESIESRESNLDEFKTIILNETSKVLGKLKTKILKTITNLNQRNV